MKPLDVTTLLNMTESETFDFKSGEYRFSSPATDDEKAELLKDIMAFANSWKTGDAYIVIGVSEKNQRKDQVIGVTTHLQDNQIQQFVNSKTNHRVDFLVYSETAEGKAIDVIRIAQRQQRPIYLTKSYGKLKVNDVWMRSGSSSALATPGQVAEMVRADQQATLGEARMALEWADPHSKVRIGSEMTVAGTKLVNPAPAPPKPKSRPPTALEQRIQGFQPMHIRPVAAQIRAIPAGEPTAEELIEFAKKRALFSPIGIWLQNLGPRNASNVKVRIMIPKIVGVLVVDRGGLPKKPQNSMLMAFASSRIPMETTVEERPSGWCVKIDAKTIQPQDEFWSSESFYISCSESMTIDANATIFADNLEKPIEVALRITAIVNEREIAVSDLYGKAS